MVARGGMGNPDTARQLAKAHLPRTALRDLGQRGVEERTPKVAMVVGADGCLHVRIVAQSCR